MSELPVLYEKGRTGESDVETAEVMMPSVAGESCPCCDVSVLLQFRSEDLIAQNVAVAFCSRWVELASRSIVSCFPLPFS